MTEYLCLSIERFVDFLSHLKVLETLKQCPSM